MAADMAALLEDDREVQRELGTKLQEAVQREVHRRAALEREREEEMQRRAALERERDEELQRRLQQGMCFESAQPSATIWWWDEGNSAPWEGGGEETTETDRMPAPDEMREADELAARRDPPSAQRIRELRGPSGAADLPLPELRRLLGRPSDLMRDKDWQADSLWARRPELFRPDRASETWFALEVKASWDLEFGFAEGSWDGTWTARIREWTEGGFRRGVPFEASDGPTATSIKEMALVLCRAGASELLCDRERGPSRPAIWEGRVAIPRPVLAPTTEWKAVERRAAASVVRDVMVSRLPAAAECPWMTTMGPARRDPSEDRDSTLEREAYARDAAARRINAELQPLVYERFCDAHPLLASRPQDRHPWAFRCTRGFHWDCPWCSLRCALHFRYVGWPRLGDAARSFAHWLLHPLSRDRCLIPWFTDRGYAEFLEATGFASPGDPRRSRKNATAGFVAQWCQDVNIDAAMTDKRHRKHARADVAARITSLTGDLLTSLVALHRSATGGARAATPPRLLWRLPMLPATRDLGYLRRAAFRARELELAPPISVCARALALCASSIAGWYLAPGTRPHLSRPLDGHLQRACSEMLIARGDPDPVERRLLPCAPLAPPPPRDFCYADRGGDTYDLVGEMMRPVIREALLVKSKGYQPRKRKRGSDPAPTALGSDLFALALAHSNETRNDLPVCRWSVKRMRAAAESCAAAWGVRFDPRARYAFSPDRPFGAWLSERRREREEALRQQKIEPG